MKVDPLGFNAQRAKVDPSNVKEVNDESRHVLYLGLYAMRR
jgi:hypothetical protein